MSLSDLKEQIIKAANSAITLEIRTIVGPIEVDDDNRITTAIDKKKLDDTKAIISKIDLLQGDITTKMDREFVDGDLQSLRSFHLEKETKGQGIIESNIKLLGQLAEFIAEKAKGLEGGDGAATDTE